MTKLLPAALIAATCGLASAAAGATSLSFGGQTYSFGASETVVAPFTEIPGVGTTASYSGLALITVSGTGNGAWGGTLNDAFYPDIPFGSGLLPGFCGALGMDTQALPGGCGHFAQDAMVYSLDDQHFVGLAGGTYVPAYQSTHVYRFVVSVDRLLADHGQASAQPLWFGTTDGSYADNGGAFTVEVAQLTAAAAVPEPAAWALMAAGLLGVAGLRRRA